MYIMNISQLYPNYTVVGDNIEVLAAFAGESP